MKKAICFTLAVMFSAVTMAGGAFAEETKDASDLLIGYTTYADYEESCLEFQAGIKDAAAEYGVELVTFNSNADTDAQATGIETFIAQEVDAMCIGAVDSDAIVPSVDAARAAGIKVLNFDIVANTEVDGSVSVDNGKLAATCAEYLAEALNYEGKVLVLSVPPSVASIRERCDAEIAVFESYGMEVVEVANSSPERSAEMADFENALTSNPDAVGMMGVDTDSTMGAYLAAQAQGRTDIKVCGPNLVNETKELIAADDSILIGMADARNYEIGYLAMQNTIKLALGEEIEPVVLDEFEVKNGEACREMLAGAETESE